MGPRLISLSEVHFPKEDPEMREGRGGASLGAGPSGVNQAPIVPMAVYDLSEPPFG